MINESRNPVLAFVFYLIKKALGIFSEDPIDVLLIIFLSFVAGFTLGCGIQFLAGM